MLKLAVIGTGYLGATHAACMAKMGFEVIGVDNDANKVATLSKGELPFYEPTLPELLSEQVKSGRLKFTSDLSEISDCDVHFICVGTPQVENGLAADLTFISNAFEAVCKVAKSGALLVGKSTVPVGTAQKLSSQMPKHLELAWNPEFLREGFAVEDTLRPNRLVVGVTSDRAEEILKKVYQNNLKEGTPWIRADLPTAELVKVAANSFLATKISFINAMAEICEAAGGDVTVLAKAIGYDPRIGNRFLQAGIGFGGGCLPKDIRAFLARGEELGGGASLQFLTEVDHTNQRARTRAVDIAVKELGEPSGKKIAVLGAAFKPDSDDVRDSPALEIANSLAQLGASVFVTDPRAIKNAAEKIPELNYCESITETIRDADLIMLLTEWSEYRALDPVEVKKLVKSATIFDGRNALDVARWQSAGWRLLALGRPL